MNRRIMVLAILSLVVGISYIADAAAEPTGAVDDYAGTTNSRFVTIIDVLGNDVSGAVITDVTQPTTPKGSSPVLGVSYGTVSHNGTHVTWTPDLRASVDLQWPTSVAHSSYRLPIHFNYTITANSTTDTARVSLNLTADRLDPSSDIAEHEPAYSPEARADRFSIDLAPTSLDVLANDAVHPTGAESGALSITDVTHVRVRESRITVLEDGRTSYAPIFEPEHTGTVSISNNGTRLVYTPGTNVTHRPTAYTALFEYTVTDGRYIGKAIVELHVDDRTLTNDRINPTVIDILEYHNATGLTVSSAGPVTSVDPDRVGTISHNTTHVTFTPGQNINDLPYPVPNHAEFVLEYGLSDGQTGTATIVLYDGSDFAVFGDTIRSKYRNGSHVHTLDVLSNDILPGGATITSVSELRLENPHLTQAQMAQWLSQNTSYVCNDGFGTERCYELAIAGQRASLGSITIAEDGRSITYTEAGPYSTDTFPNIEIPNLYTSTTVQYPLVFDYTVTAGSENLTGTVWLVSAAPLPGADGPIDAVDDTVDIEPSSADKYPSAKIFVLNNDEADGVAVTITEEPRHGSVLVRPDPIRINSCTIEVGQYVYDEDGNIEDFHLFNNTGKVSNDGGAGYDLNGATCEETDAPDYYPAILTYTADAYYSGTDSFEYTVTRGGIESDTATVRLNIGDADYHVQIDPSSIPRFGVHAVPTTETTPGGQTVTVIERTYYKDRAVLLNNHQYNFTVRAHDPDGTDIVFALEGASSGMRIHNTTGEFSWTPASVGTFDFTVTASSGGDTDRAAVKFEVVRENAYTPARGGVGNASDYYIARNDTAVAQSGTPARIDVLANDQCGGGLNYTCNINPGGETGLVITDSSMYDPVTRTNTTLAILEGPSNGTARIAGGEVRYRSAAGYTGTDTITYEIATSGPYRQVGGVLVNDMPEYTDEDGPVVHARTSASATLTISVEPANPVKEDRVTVPVGTMTVIDVLANDAPGTNITAVSDTTRRSTSVSLDGNTITYRSDNPGLVSADRFSYNATYNGQTYTAWVFVTISDTVAAVPDTAHTRPGNSVLIDVLANDILPHGRPAIQNVTQPQNGTATIEGDRVRYTPRTNYTGIDTFAYVIPGGDGTLTANVTVIVSGPAEARDDSATAVSGRPVIIPVLDNDINTAGVTVTLANIVTITDITISSVTSTIPYAFPNGTVVNDPNYNITRQTPVATTTTETAQGTVEVLPDRTIRYTSPDGYAGTDRFVYRLDQASGRVSEATVTVDVRSIDDEASATQNRTVLIPVLDNDMLGDPATVWIIHDPAYGQAEVLPNGTILYRAPEDHTGTDIFRYVASDGNITTGHVTVNVTVSAPEGPLMASDIHVYTPANMDIRIKLFEDDGRVELASLESPQAGQGSWLETNFQIHVSDGYITYRHNDDGFVGTLIRPYSLIRDGTDQSNKANIHLTVGAANDNGQAPQGQPVTIPVLANDGTTGYSLDGVSDPPGGSATHDATAGTVTYTSDAGFVGTDRFTYTTTNSSGGAAIAPTVTIEVLPLAVDDTARVREDSQTGVNIYVLRNDNIGTLDGNEAARIVGNLAISDPQNGRASQTDPSNSFITYRPDPDFSGIDTFTYTINHTDTPNGNETSVTATVTVTVTPVSERIDFEIPRHTSDGSNFGIIPVGQEYTFTASVTENLDNVPYRFELGHADASTALHGDHAVPENAQMTPQGVFTWTPTAEQAGSRTIWVRLVPLVEDLDPTNKTLNLCVANEPSISPIDDIQVFEGQKVALNVTLDSSCPTAPPVLTLAEAPEGATLFGYMFETVTLVFGTNDTGTPVTETRQVQRRIAGDDFGYLSDPRNHTFSRTLDNGTTVTETVTLERRTYGFLENDFEWTPGPVDTPTDYTVTIRAAGLNIADETFVITVNPVKPQLTAPYRYYTLETGENFYSLPFRDTRFLSYGGNGTLTYSVSDDRPAGLTVVAHNGTIRWTPAANDTGRHEFDFVVSDGQYEDTMRVIIVVMPQLENRDPVLDDLREFTIINAERSYNFTAEADDADDDPLTFNLTGNVPENATIGSTDGLFEWTPGEPGQLGNHTFTIVVSDDRGGSDSATITLQVVGANVTVNNPPLLSAIGAQTVDEGQTLEIRPEADDLEGAPLTYELTRGTLPAAATFNTTNGHLDWTPGEEDGGATHDITITVSDGSESDSESITITVTETNQNPVISDVPAQDATVGQELTVTLNATDADLPAQTLEYDITGDDLGATISGTTLSWTPTSAHVGNQSLTVRVQDDFSPRGSDATTISITVSGGGNDTTPMNTAPTAASFELAVQAPNARTVDLAAAGHINDAEQAPGTLGVTLDTSTLTLGSATVTGTTITYTPNGPEGTETMTYTVTDNEGATDTGTITITVTTQPITVTAEDDAIPVDEGATVTINVLDNDVISPANIPRSALEITRLDRASHGQATTDGSTVTYTANTFGTDPTPTRTETLEYTVMVQGGNSDTATITITINNVNMRPDAQDSTAFVAVNSTDVMIPLSVSDPDGDMPLTVTITGQPTLGTATSSGTTIIYTPRVNVTGTDTITYSVADPGGESATATLTIIIAAFGGGSDSGNDWRKAPTFGRSFNTDEMIVSCGYSMDGECRDVTDYHVDYERQTIETGSTHDFTLRAYGDQTLEMFQLGFGMPQIGSPLNTAEALIEITVSPNYDPDSSGYDVTKVVYRNPNNVIDEDAVITARDIACQPGSELVCVQVDIKDVTFREQMYHEPFGIFVMDTDRRSSTFYMNEGLLVEGESLNPAPTATKSTKSGNQAETLTLQLTRTDKLSNIWTDQIGNRWTQNEYGTWLLIYAVPKSFATACTDEDNRYCDAFQTRLDVHHDLLEDIRDDRYGDIYTTPAYDDLTEAITILDMDGDSRTAFLEQNGMMWVRQGS